MPRNVVLRWNIKSYSDFSTLSSLFLSFSNYIIDILNCERNSCLSLKDTNNHFRQYCAISLHQTIIKLSGKPELSSLSLYPFSLVPSQYYIDEYKKE